MNHKPLPITLLLVLALSLGIIFGPVMIEALAFAFAPAPVYASAAEQAAPDSIDAYATHLCQIDFVSTDNRGVQVNCLNPVNGIYVFRSAEEDPTVMARKLSVLLTGKATGQPLWVTYNDAASGNPQGCPAGYCRNLTGAYLR